MFLIVMQFLKLNTFKTFEVESLGYMGLNVQKDNVLLKSKTDLLLGSYEFELQPF